jgi:putative salt-induced outer membrane protein
MKKRNILTASVLALLVAAPGAFAQGALVGVDDLDERIDDIQEDVNDDLTQANRRDRSLNQYAQGWTGSFALGLSATSGNTDTGDLDFAGRLRYGNGPWNHTIAFAGEFSEDNSIRNKEEIFVTYDVNRYFSEDFYVFGLGSVRFDDFDSNRLDAFLGFGPGYRVINEPNRSWRIQAGPGVRYIEDQNRVDSTEIAGIASSRYFFAMSENVSFSMDTDVLFSDEDTVVTNDLGVNFKVTDRVSTRVSLRTDWDSDPLAGLKSTDNSLGVSLVYGF